MWNKDVRGEDLEIKIKLNDNNNLINEWFLVKVGWGFVNLELVLSYISKNIIVSFLNYLFRS